MKIAVFVNQEGNTGNFNSRGIIRVYEKDTNDWSVRDSFSFDLGQSQSAVMMRENLKMFMNRLSDCNVLVGDKIIGLAYNILDRSGIHIWEFKGKPEEFLDIVLRKETDMEQELTSTQEEPFVQLGSGRYYVNIKEILLANGEITSKKIMFPFFDEVMFDELHVVFSHIPPWLGPELEKRALTMNVEAESIGEVQVVIQRRLDE